MNNTTTCGEIKSVGFCGDDGCVIDDSAGLQEFIESFEEGEVVKFEDGLKELKEYVLQWGEKEDWVEVESKLKELKEEVGNEGVWKTWGVEYDYNLGVAL